MNEKLMRDWLTNLQEIEQALKQEQIDIILELIDKNEVLIQTLNHIQKDHRNDDPNFVCLKETVMKKNSEIITQLSELKQLKKIEFMSMSKKVQVSKVYNNMKRTMY